MKRTILLALLPMLLAVACTDKKPSAPATSGQSCDSLIVKIDSLGVAFTLRADIPAANSALQQNLADYIASKLFMPEDSIAAPTYNGDLHTFLKDCARIKWQEMESDTFDGYPEALGPDDDGITAAEAREMAAMAAATDSIFLSSGETAFRMVCSRVEHCPRTTLNPLTAFAIRFWPRKRIVNNRSCIAIIAF